MTINSDPQVAWGEEDGQVKDIMNFKLATIMGPAINYAKLTPTGSTGPTGAVPLTQGPTRALIADAAGTFVGQDAFGNAVSGMPVGPGWNAISISALISITGPTGGLSVLFGVW
jgi:hypothetical protein